MVVEFSLTLSITYKSTTVHYIDAFKPVIDQLGSPGVIFGVMLQMICFRKAWSVAKVIKIYLCLLSTQWHFNGFAV